MFAEKFLIDNRGVVVYITREHVTYPKVMPARKTPIKRKVRNWTAADSSELYGVENWSNDYFSVSKSGEVNVHLVDTDGSIKEVSLPGIMKGLEERGTNVPVLLRFRDLLHARIDELNKSFSKAIKAAGVLYLLYLLH